MSTSFLKRAGLVLLVLLILWGLFAVLRRDTSEEIGGLVIPAIDPGSLNQVTIFGATDTIYLVRLPDNNWEANGLPAANSVVNELYNAVFDTTTMAQSELAARSASSHARMGVTDMGNSRMLFMAGTDTLADLRVGNPAAGGKGAFVRLGDAPEVYRVKGDLARLGSQGVDSWRDKSIAAVAEEDVGSVEVAWPGRRYTLARSDEGRWTIDGAPTDTVAAAAFFRGYIDLQATGFPTAAEAETIDFTRPDGRIVMRGMAGDTLAALVFDSTATGIWARHDSGSTAYRLEPWHGARLAPSQDVLATQ
jgi:hypothetical protein